MTRCFEACGGMRSEPMLTPEHFPTAPASEAGDRLAEGKFNLLCGDGLHLLGGTRAACFLCFVVARLAAALARPLALLTADLAAA